MHMCIYIIKKREDLDGILDMIMSVLFILFLSIGL